MSGTIVAAVNVSSRDAWPLGLSHSLQQRSLELLTACCRNVFNRLLAVLDITCPSPTQWPDYLCSDQPPS